MKPDIEINGVTSVDEEISVKSSSHVSQTLDISVRMDKINSINTDGLKLVKVSDTRKSTPDMNGNTRPLSSVVQRLKGE